MMLRFLPLILLAVATGFYFPAQAQLRLNKGPVFKYVDTVNQNTLVKDYLLFNAKNYVRNKNLETDLNRKALKLKEIKLTPLPAEQLKFEGLSYKDSKENYITWDHKVDLYYGLCNGVAMVTRQFATYAIFRPKLKVPVKFKTPEDREKYFNQIVDSIMASEPTIIPEYPDFNSFLNSEGRLQIRTHVADQWGLYTANLTDYISNTAIHYNKTPVLQKHTLHSTTKLFDQIKYFLDRNFYPKLVTGFADALTLDGNPHVVLVTQILSARPTKENPIIEIEVLDNGHLRNSFIFLGQSQHLASDNIYHYLLAASKEKKKQELLLFPYLKSF